MTKRLLKKEGYTSRELVFTRIKFCKICISLIKLIDFAKICSLKNSLENVNFQNLDNLIPVKT